MQSLRWQHRHQGLIQLIKFELNAELYHNPVELFESLSAPSTAKICIVAHNVNATHTIRHNLQDHLEYHGIIHKVHLHDNRISTPFGNIWIITQDTCVEKSVGHHGIRLFITEIALEHLQIGAIKYLNSRTIPWLSKSDVRIADLPPVT